ncbi:MULTISPECIES: hypothetical protein [Glycomyces]|uniref:Uncharacterized protein n=2 Tax=Glycomyces TaxID=58113 RepID=A0A9X3SVS1_9ACTN|nr:hypothetical protein [Glycomyces lechevalierae]MDA1386955.1 hypothetical protein [Glycomyces lechevalierae]MDR7341572.1 hypothetical protein [Glycomyces lechevalierae]
MEDEEFASPDAYRATGVEVRLPPDAVRTFTRYGLSRVEYEAEPVALEIIGLFRNHGVPITEELHAAACDLALAAVLTRA